MPGSPLWGQHSDVVVKFSTRRRGLSFAWLNERNGIPAFNQNPQPLAVQRLTAARFARVARPVPSQLQASPLGGINRLVINAQSTPAKTGLASGSAAMSQPKANVARHSLRQMAVNVAHHLSRMGESVVSEVSVGSVRQQNDFFARLAPNRSSPSVLFKPSLWTRLSPARRPTPLAIYRLFEVRDNRAGTVALTLLSPTSRLEVCTQPLDRCWYFPATAANAPATLPHGAS